MQETLQTIGKEGKHYSPRRNMTNTSALNAEAAPYNQAKNL
jgi:hypothetical protein